MAKFLCSQPSFFAVRPGGNEMVDIAYGAAGVYGAVIAAPSMLALYFYLRLLSQARRYEVITGKGYRPKDIESGKIQMGRFGLHSFLYGACRGFAASGARLGFASSLSADAFTTGSFKDQLHKLQRFSSNFRGPWRLHQHVDFNGCATSLVLFFGLMVSWVVVRARVRFYKVMDMIAMLPHAIPGLVFAFALFILGLLAARWLPWLPLQGTLTIIVLANVINQLSYVTRVTNSALVQVQSDLEECAQLCGLNNLSILRQIVAPLIKPSLILLAYGRRCLHFVK